MVYSKSAFAKALEVQLDLGYEPKRIGSWAHTIYLQHCGKIDRELEEILIGLFVLEEGPEFECPESTLRELVQSLQPILEGGSFNKHQIRLWKSMIEFIESYLNHETQDFYKVVGELEGALDASEIKDNDLINQWYDFWIPLEIRRAVQGNYVDRTKAEEELLAMKEFLLKGLS